MKVVFVNVSEKKLTIPKTVARGTSNEELWETLFTTPWNENSNLPHWSKRISKRITLHRNENGYSFFGSGPKVRFVVLACTYSQCTPSFPLVRYNKNKALRSIFNAIKGLVIAAGAAAVVGGIATGLLARQLLKQKEGKKEEKQQEQQQEEKTEEQKELEKKELEKKELEQKELEKKELEKLEKNETKQKEQEQKEQEQKKQEQKKQEQKEQEQKKQEQKEQEQKEQDLIEEEYKKQSRLNWRPNDPFVVHFLLDGLSNPKFGSYRTAAAQKCQLMIQGLQQYTYLAEELKFVEEVSDTKYKMGLSLEDKIEIEMESIPSEITKNMIITAGPEGHAIGFRFLYTEKIIILLNSGEGINKYHKKSTEKKGFYQLYKVWQFQKDEDFQSCVRKVRAGAKCKDIATIDEAYLYQVDVIPDKFKVDMSFNDSGAEEVPETWMTNKKNWLIEGPALFCRPQIAGSCTFHSLYWLMLLDVWRTNSKKASTFEKSCRFFVLEKAISVSPPDNQRPSEQISSLQLIVRMYPKFQGRELAMNTLLLKQTPFDKNGFVAVSKEIPLRIEEPHRLKKYADILKYIHKENDITVEVLNALNDLLDGFKSDVIDAQDLPKTDKSHWYFFYLYNVTNSSIKKIDSMTCSNSTNGHYLCFCIDSAKIYLNLNTSQVLSDALNFFGTRLNWDWQQSTRLRTQYQGMFIGIMSKLHSKLPKTDQLPIHPILFENVNDILVNNTRCETIVFTRHYANYMYNKATLKNQQITDAWKKCTKEPTHEPQFANKYKNSFSERIYESFVRSSFVNEFVSLVFMFAVMNDSFKGAVTDVNLNFNDPSYERESLFPRDQIQLATAMTGFVADLNKTIPLSLLTTKDSYLLPQFEFFENDCKKKSGDAILTSSIPAADMNSFYENRTTWMKNAWIRAAPQIKSAATDSNNVINIVIWLLYLWPEGPPSNMKKDLSSLSHSDLPMINNMLAIWRDRKGNIKELTQQHLEFGMQKEKPDRHRLIIELFASSLLHNDLSILDGLLEGFSFYSRLRESKVNVLGGPVGIWPVVLQDKTYDLKLTTTTIEEKTTIVYYPTDSTNWWNQIWVQCSQNKIPCVIYEEDNIMRMTMFFDKEVKISMYAGNDQFYILTPAGQYEVLPPHMLPPCMRPWCLNYENCVALGLRQDKNLFLFIAGKYTPTLATSIFDNTKENPRFDKLWQLPSQWFIFKMHACGGILPVINRDTPGWYFLLENLITSAKQSCLELIRPITSLIGKPSKNEQPLVDRHWPSVRSHEITADRRPYFDLINAELPAGNTSTSTVENQLWRHLSTCISSLPLKELYSLLRQMLNQDPTKPVSNRTLFEIASGLSIRPDQHKLLETMETVTDKQSVVQTALMGIGKSKVLLPTLTIFCCMEKRQVYIVQPGHLVPQTINTLDEIMPLVGPSFIADYEVLSDVSAKRNYLDCRIENKTWIHQNRVVLFDEIDSMYNCFKSEFNRPTSTPVRHPKIVDEDMTSYYKLVVESCYGETQNSKLSALYPDFWVKFNKNVVLCKKMKFLLQYGPTAETLLAVPYSAVDTPIIGSNFSDIDITALLTCLVRKQKGLSSRDFIFLQARLHQMRSIFPIDDLLPSVKPAELFALTLHEQVQKYGKDEQLQRFYLSCVLLPDKLRAFTKQYNISFIDLMDEGFAKNRIGFSGTTLMHIPEFSNGAWKPTIIPDIEGENKIKSAIVGDSGIVNKYKAESDLWDLIKEFDVLIDAGAILRDKGMSIEIVKRWDESENKAATYVFIDAAHVAREYKRGETVYPPYKFRENITFRWYFDQPHTVGIDLQITETAKGLTLVDNDSLLTDVAQAIYRLRGINKGQSVQFMTNGERGSRLDIYNHLKANEERYKEQLLTRHYLQNVKTLDRSHNYYRQKTYEEDVKYFEGNIQYKKLYAKEPSLPETDKFVKVFNDLLQKLTQRTFASGTAVDIQVEQAREIVHKKGYANCKLSTPTKPNSTTVTNYGDPTWGSVIVKNRLYMSPTVSQSLHYELDTLCVLVIKDSCKIITIDEWLLLQTYKSNKQQTYFRLDKLPENTNSTVLLALALCGRILSLDQQMKVIRDTTIDALLESQKCFQRLDYDMFHEYLYNSDLERIPFLQECVQTVEDFVNKYIRVPIQSTALIAYYKTCKEIVENLTNK